MMPQSHSDLAYEIIEQWTRLVGTRAPDRERIGQAVCNVLDEAVECARRSNDWRKAEQCCAIGFDICQCDPTEKAEVTGLTGRSRDPHFSKAATEFHYGVFLLGQSKLESALEYFRMSARDFAHSFHVEVSHNSSSVGACLARWACGKVEFARQVWGQALHAYQYALDSLDKRDTRAEELRRMLEQEITTTRQAIRQHQHAPANSSSTARVAPQSPKLRCIPILARIAAGTPLPTGDGTPFDRIDPDNLLGAIFLDEEHARDATFGLLVKGDSMCEAGILDGDCALIRKQEDAANGTIAVVRIVHEGYDEEATLKKYFKESDHWCLKPANRRYKPIVVVSRGDRERIVREYAKQGIEVDARVGANVLVIGRVVGIWRRVD